MRRLRKTNSHHLLSGMLITVMMVMAAFIFSAEPVQAADTVEVNYQVQYMQTASRTMLDMINEFRTGDDAWYWNSDDTTKTICTGLSELTYDYALEKVAMQRCAEIALSYSHTRPNGGTPYTAYSDAGYSYGYAGENIAAGYNLYTTAAAVFEGWQETDENYSGQGHRRNMLSGNFARVGIAGCKIGNGYYWVQEFATSTGAITETVANDAVTDVTVNVTTSDLTVNMTLSSSSISLEEGASASLPTATVMIKGPNYWPSSQSGMTSTDSVTWSVADASVAEISGTSLKAKAAGSTTLTASLYGTTQDVAVTVAGHVHTWDSGTVTTPATCAAEGVMTYKCTSCGETKTEAIAKTSDHTWDSGAVTTPATCAAEGVKTYKCTVCGTMKAEAIAKTTEHTWDDGTVTTPATCAAEGVMTYKCTVCGTMKAESIAKTTEHTWDDGTVTTPATCAAAGVKTYKCTVCGTTKTENIAKLTTHTWNGGAVTQAATCAAAGVKTYTCTVCNTTKTESIPKTDNHTWDCVGTDRDSCEEEGTAYYECTVCGAEKTETLAAGEHSWDAGEVTEEPDYDYEGEMTYTCTVCGETKTETIPALDRIDISGAVVEFCDDEDDYYYDGTDYIYCGDEIEPYIEVYYNSEELTEYDDYTVEYSDNVEPGTATITITGIEKYTGTLSVPFTIAKANAYYYNDTDLDETYIAAGESTYVSLPDGVDSSDCEFYSEDEDVATVDEDGIVYGVGEGTTYIAVYFPETDYCLAELVRLEIEVYEDDDTWYDAPANFEVTSTSAGIKLSWDPVDENEDLLYMIAVIAEGDVDEEFCCYTTSNCEYLDENVSLGGTYIYWVGAVAINEEAEEDEDPYIYLSYDTDPVKITFDGKISSSDLTVANTTTGVNIKWPKVPGAKGYYVYRKSGTSGYTRITSSPVTGTSYTNTKLTSGTTYTYCVRPYTTIDGSLYVGEYERAGKSIRYLSSVTPTLANAASGIAVKWTKVTGASGYYVYRKAGSGSYARIATITSGSTVIYGDKSSLTNGTAYTYCVRPYYKDSNGNITLASFTGKAIYRITTVTQSTPTNSASKTMTVKWSRNTAASGYQIQYATNSSFTSAKLVALSGNTTVSKKIASLTKGKTYYVRVRAFKKNSAGTVYYGGWSSVKTVKITK